ncbi:MAG: hypothetical protein JXR51_06955 [Bacteroidales bacterium]|nr:hypothetical protein [Bacteroidales bacterium]
MNRIPPEIFYNSHSHTEILPKQKGDFVYEMNEKYRKIYKRKERYEKEAEEKIKTEQEQLEEQLSYKIYKFIKKLFVKDK